MTRVTCSFHLFLCVAAIVCANVFCPAAPADVVTTGNVEPANPTTWTASTPARVGNTADGTLTVSGGSQITANSGRIGYDPGVTGVATITGANSSWLCNIETHVGHSGNGTLNITNGGRVYFNITGSFSWDSSIGYNPGSTGAMTVDGAGSRWEYLSSAVTSNLYVGKGGNGTLDITNGGTVINSNGHIGNDTGSIGVVAVDGTNSTWQLKGSTGGNGSLTVGNFGSGTLNITNGGAVSNASNGRISKGIVTVDGADSTWTLDGLYVGINSSDNGTLNITNGGAVSNRSGTLGGFFAGAMGAVNVDGAGSTWTNSGSLKVGNTGVGRLNITGGGQVGAEQSASVRSSSLIALSVTNDNMLQVGTAGSYDLTNDGLISLSAAPGLAAGIYSPISVTGSWLGSGTYEAFGGLWDGTAHTFTVAAPQTTTSGVPVTIDLATTQRIDVGTSLVVNFKSAGSQTLVDFNATEISGTERLALESMLDPGHFVLSIWDFDISGVPVGNETGLSFGLIADPGDSLTVWHDDGSGWMQFDVDLINSGSWASFTVDSFSSYAITGVPEPATLALLALGGLVLLAGRRRGN